MSSSATSEECFPLLRRDAIYIQFTYRGLRSLNFSSFNQDTCGVHNLHGMPAILSALVSVLFAYVATEEAYGDSLHTIFPGMKNSTAIRDDKIIGVRSEHRQIDSWFRLIINLCAISAELNHLFFRFHSKHYLGLRAIVGKAGALPALRHPQHARYCHRRWLDYR